MKSVSKIVILQETFPNQPNIMKRFNIIAVLIALAFLSASAIKITSGPYLQLVTENEATVVWTTDKKAVSWVETAPDDNLHFYAEERPKHYSTYLGRAVIDTVHRVRIRNLKKGTTYRYRIFSHEVLEEGPYYVAYGRTASTDVYGRKPLTLTTCDSSRPSVEFIVVNDIHGDSAKFMDLTRSFEKGKTDFVIFNGDMVSSMESERQIMTGFVNNAVKKFASETPFYMSRGNHETRGNFAKNYLSYFPTPTGMPYYCFREGPVFFIVMDGGEDKPDSSIEYSGTAFFDEYREQEAAWLKKVVESDDFRNASYRIVITHVPPVQDTWHGPLHAKKLFLPILNKAGIDLMLCGHLHRYVYNEPGTDGAEFPILVNSNKHTVNVKADRESLLLTVNDREGKEFKRYTYPRK